MHVRICAIYVYNFNKTVKTAMVCFKKSKGGTGC